MKAAVIGGGVLAAVAVALAVAFVATRGGDSASSEQSSGDRASGAVPPRGSTSDVQAGLDFARSLVDTGRAIYEGERAREAASRQARQASGGSVPPRQAARS